MVRKSGALPAASTRNPTSSTKRRWILRDEKMPTQEAYKYTKGYRLGQVLCGLTRHFLLMTATPHNGKEEDFQLFPALLDGDRFEGRFRDGVHQVEVSDLMRRMVKESLLKFDGRRRIRNPVQKIAEAALNGIVNPLPRLVRWLMSSR